MMDAALAPNAAAHRRALDRRGNASAVVATDYANWPEPLRAQAARPRHEREIPPMELRDFLDPARPREHDWTCPSDLPGPVFPKIGVCSFKAFPWLLPYGADVPLNLFSFCSDRMRLVLSAWIEREEPAFLRFFPWRDHSDVNEYRFDPRTGTLLRSLLRDDHDGSNAARALLGRCTHGLERVSVDVATHARPSGIEAWIVEINPLTGAR